MISNIKHVPMHVEPIGRKYLYNIKPIAIKHLFGSLRSLASGRAPTPSFKLYGKSDVSLVDDFFAYVKKRGVKISKWQLEYELSRKTKWGPQGGFAPWSELKDDFELYYSRPTIMNDEFRSIVMNNIPKCYSLMHIQRLELSETLPFLIGDDKIRDRASGWRCFDLKKTSEVAQTVALADCKSGNWINGYGYTFSRFNKQKKRLFFPMPYSLMILEAQYYSPFLKFIQNSLKQEKDKSPFIFWADKIGFDRMFNDIVTPIVLKDGSIHGWTLVYVQRDFEKMDTTMGYSQTATSFMPRIIQAFNLSGDELERFEKIMHVSATCPIATPSGMYLGYRGKASGAETTNGDETCSNEDYDTELTSRILSACKTVRIEMKKLYSAGNGDDGFSIFALKNLSKLDEFKKIIAEQAESTAADFGFRVQGSKWFISTEYGLYCQRMVARKGDKIWNGYPATLVLNSIVNPEKEYTPKSWDKDYRDLDIIEKLDNARNLEYFTELIDFVDNGMKYHLMGSSEEDFRRILSKFERYRALQDTPFNFQDFESYRDITKSPTIAYLLSKRGYSLSR